MDGCMGLDGSSQCWASFGSNWSSRSVMGLEFFEGRFAGAWGGIIGRRFWGVGMTELLPFAIPHKHEVDLGTWIPPWPIGSVRHL